MAVTANISYWKLQKFSKLLLVITIILLIAVLFIGVERNNAKVVECSRFKHQPSEIAKFRLYCF